MNGSQVNPIQGVVALHDPAGCLTGGLAGQASIAHAYIDAMLAAQSNNDSIFAISHRRHPNGTPDRVNTRTLPGNAVLHLLEPLLQVLEHLQEIAELKEDGLCRT